ncbi:DUF4124 domain-containing protein [Duganella sp. FT3S]|uniref:DUF4124 domain-containing protein n=1 Tax=Rugamonas fusca TaxID=2758568 RepID=A0A7W2EKB3_9BURK|nr:DUF4124 domain-containing protein [Rugamonas fusca]MBA5607439.1 DUF4124 domain-containing protein [Rugamonas fusca]
MKHTPTTLRVALAAALLAISTQALAQYLWIDEKGIKQLSDRPPPPNIPEKNILKAPGKPLFNPNAPAPDEQAADAAEPKAKAPPTLGERNADFNKRRTEAAQAARKSAEETRRKAAEQANCEAARNNQRALDEGVRMTTYDKDGQRVVMGDAERAEAARKNQQVLANCH